MTITISAGDGLSLQSQLSSDCDMVTPSTVQLPLDRFKIVHATTERVRIRANDSSFYSRLESISQQLRQQVGVREVISNIQTGSLVVNFDQHQVSLPQIVAILQKLGAVDLESPGETDLFAEWKSASYWQEQSIGLIPLVTGLTVTGGLGISGWAAIPVYMITADATRWMIDNLPMLPFGHREEGTGHGQDYIHSLNDATVNPTPLAMGRLSLSTHEQIQSCVAFDVVHAIPGRVRLHVPQLAQDRAYARRLEWLLKTDDAVTSVRVNCHAASVAIAYRKEVDVCRWVELLELALQCRLSMNSVAEVKGESGVWMGMKPVALSYCLDCLANLSFV